MQYEPSFYERKAISFLIDRPYAALMLPSEAERARIALTVAMKMLRGYEDARQVLVVSELRSIDSVWIAAMKRWNHLQGLRWGVIRGSERQRVAMMESDKEILFVSHMLLPWLTGSGRWRYPYVIVDGASCLKNKHTQEYRCVLRVRPLIQHFILVAPGASEAHIAWLWARVFLLDGGRRLGASEAAFYERYGNVKAGLCRGRGHTICGLKAQAMERISERIRDICFWNDPSVLLAASRFAHHDVYVYMDAKERSKYRIAGNVGMRDCGEAYVSSVSGRKRIALSRIMEDIGDERVIVGCGSARECERIREHIPAAYLLKDEINLERWRTGKIKVGCVNYSEDNPDLGKCGGVLVWYSIPQSRVEHERIIASMSSAERIPAITVYYVIVAGTADEVYRRELASDGR